MANRQSVAVNYRLDVAMSDRDRDKLHQRGEKVLLFKRKDSADVQVVWFVFDPFEDIVPVHFNAKLYGYASWQEVALFEMVNGQAPQLINGGYVYTFYGAEFDFGCASDLPLDWYGIANDDLCPGGITFGLAKEIGLQWDDMVKRPVDVVEIPSCHKYFSQLPSEEIQVAVGRGLASGMMVPERLFEEPGDDSLEFDEILVGPLLTVDFSQEREQTIYYDSVNGGFSLGPGPGGPGQSRDQTDSRQT